MGRKGNWIPLAERRPEEYISPLTGRHPEYLCTVVVHLPEEKDMFEVRSFEYGDGHFWRAGRIMDSRILAWEERPDVYEGDKDA